MLDQLDDDDLAGLRPLGARSLLGRRNQDVLGDAAVLGGDAGIPPSLLQISEPPRPY